MISFEAAILQILQPFSIVSMRALALLCLLHVGYSQYSWDGPSATLPPLQDTPGNDCQMDQVSCGCCLMRKQMYRMEMFLNYTCEKMSEKLEIIKRKLDDLRGGRSAFSVALHSKKTSMCYGPFDNDTIINYKHAFLNLGDGYNYQTGIFTVPRNGIYSLSVTIYGSGSSCARLHLNGKLVTELLENKGLDPEDSATIVVAKKLKAMDQVTVVLPKKCILCDKNSNYNTFTGYLLYGTAYESNID